MSATFNAQQLKRSNRRWTLHQQVRNAVGGIGGYGRAPQLQEINK
jgi:hypothetical protein